MEINSSLDSFRTTISISFFTFRISYYSEPAKEEVRHLAFDCERGKVDKRPYHRQVLRASADGHLKEFKPSPRPDFDTALRAVWEVIQDEIEMTVHAIQQEGRAAVDEKIETVERYYRQLLAEEKKLYSV